MSWKKKTNNCRKKNRSFINSQGTFQKPRTAKELLFPCHRGGDSAEPCEYVTCSQNNRSSITRDSMDDVYGFNPVTYIHEWVLAFSHCDPKVIAAVLRILLSRAKRIEAQQSQGENQCVETEYRKIENVEMEDRLFQQCEDKQNEPEHSEIRQQQDCRTESRQKEVLQEADVKNRQECNAQKRRPQYDQYVKAEKVLSQAINVESRQNQDAQTKYRYVENDLHQDVPTEKRQIQDAQIEHGQFANIHIENKNAPTEDGQSQDVPTDNGQSQDVCVDDGQSQGDDGQSQDVCVDDGQSQGDDGQSQDVCVDDGQSQDVHVEDGQSEDVRVDDGQIQNVQLEDGQSKNMHGENVGSQVIHLTDGQRRYVHGEDEQCQDLKVEGGQSQDVQVEDEDENKEKMCVENKPSENVYAENSQRHDVDLQIIWSQKVIENETNEKKKNQKCKDSSEINQTAGNADLLVRKFLELDGGKNAPFSEIIQKSLHPFRLPVMKGLGLDDILEAKDFQKSEGITLGQLTKTVQEGSIMPVSLYLYPLESKQPPRTVAGIPWERFKDEKTRFLSFLHYPMSAPKPPKLLAANGFLYLGMGESDSVMCYFCKAVKSRWTREENVLHVHQQMSPDCPIVKEGVEVEDNKLRIAVDNLAGQLSTASQMLDGVGAVGGTEFASDVEARFSSMIAAGQPTGRGAPLSSPSLHSERNNGHQQSGIASSTLSGNAPSVQTISTPLMIDPSQSQFVGDGFSSHASLRGEEYRVELTNQSRADTSHINHPHGSQNQPLTPSSLLIQSNSSATSRPSNLSTLPRSTNASNLSIPQSLPNLPIQNQPSLPNPQNPPNLLNPQNQPSLPNPQNPPSLPNPQNPPSLPIPQSLPSLPIPQSLPSLPNPQNLPSLPNPQNPPSLPIPQSLPSLPIPQSLPSLPNPQNPPSMPSLQNLPGLPNPQNPPSLLNPQNPPNSANATVPTSTQGPSTGATANNPGASGAPNYTYRQLGIVPGRPKRPGRATVASRLETFHAWPEKYHVTPSQLVEAGFYYAGYSDCVRCFFCGCGLRNWEPDDDPTVEHACWSPECGLLRQQVGQEFINVVQTLHKKGGSVSLHNVKRELEKQGKSHLLNIRPSIGQDPAVLSLLQEGFPEVQVVEAASVLRDEGETLSADTIIQEIKSKSESKAAPMTTFNLTDVADSGTGTEAGKEDQADEKELSELRQKNKNIRQMVTCKVCMDHEVQMLFLPCGHLVSCQECSVALTSCPLCRADIKGSVRAFRQ